MKLAVTAQKKCLRASTVIAATETMSFSRNSSPQRVTLINIIVIKDEKSALIMQTILFFGQSVIFQ